MHASREYNPGPVPMPRPHSSSAIPVAIALAMLTLSWRLERRAERMERERPALRTERHLPDPEILRRAALGFHVLLADLWWLQAIQYYGTHDNAAEHFAQL